MSELKPHEARFYRTLSGEKIAADDIRPTPEQVLYAKPNPDGSRKRCDNCWMWTQSDKGCLAFTKDYVGKVDKDDICGLHVYGTPRYGWQDMDQTQDADLAGFEKSVGDGTSCDKCEYIHGNGLCHKVQDGKGNDAPVEAKGCCAAWEPK